MAGKTAVQGSITPGKWADLILLADDLFALPETAVKDATVAMTIFDGQVVFSRD